MYNNEFRKQSGILDLFILDGIHCYFMNAYINDQISNFKIRNFEHRLYYHNYYIHHINKILFYIQYNNIFQNYAM